MADDFTDAEKREAAEQLLVDWMNYPGAFNEQVPTREQAINLQCQVNRLTNEVGEAKELLDHAADHLRHEGMAWLFNRVSLWLARNGGTK